MFFILPWLLFYKDSLSISIICGNITVMKYTICSVIIITVIHEMRHPKCLHWWAEDLSDDEVVFSDDRVVLYFDGIVLSGEGIVLSDDGIDLSDDGAVLSIDEKSSLLFGRIV